MELHSPIEKWKLFVYACFLLCLFPVFIIDHSQQTVTIFLPRFTSININGDNQQSRNTLPQSPLLPNATTEPPLLQPALSPLNSSTNAGSNSSSASWTSKLMSRKQCSFFEGKWVYREEEHPQYNSSICPFLEEKVSCRKNGRPDSGYEKWVWENPDCDIPRFNGRDMMERMKGKRVIIVGDSLNRNMWESLACLLYTSIPKSRVSVHAEDDSYKVLKAQDYDFTAEFYWSPFLIHLDLKHESGRKVLVLDKLSPNSEQWRGADVMIFNSGHWWTHHGKSQAWDLFQYEGEMIEEMEMEAAYETALKTWADWINQNTDPRNTSVFFRSISPEHKGKHWCYNKTQPITDESYEIIYPRSMMEIVEKRVRLLGNAVRYLNITKLSTYRMDAHPSVCRSRVAKILTDKYKRLVSSNADCSHWCLPGLPDTWNMLLYASLFFNPSIE